jgi:hypothetical protein
MWAFVPRVPRPRLQIVHWHALGIAHLKPPQRLLKPPPFASAQPLLIQEGSHRKSSPPWLRRGGAPATGVVGSEMFKLKPRVPARARILQVQSKQVLVGSAAAL